MVRTSKWFVALLCCASSASALRREDVGVLHSANTTAGVQDVVQLTAETWFPTHAEDLLGSACRSGNEGMNEVYYSPFPGPRYKTIGDGSFGTVSLRRDVSGRRWAVKHLYKHALEDFQAQELLPLMLHLPFNSVLKEAFVKTDENAILLEANFVMPAYCCGTLFERYISERKVEQPSRSEARIVLAQIAYGLWEMHQRGMLHSDVKLENIMFASNSSLQLTLIDYGLTQTGCLNKDSCSDQCGGSREYMAPIVCRGTYSYEVDFWAWGIAVLEIFKAKSLIHVSKFNHISLRSYRYGLFDEWAGKTKNPFAHLLKLIFRRPLAEGLATQREAMSGPRPEDHPVLGHPVWLQGSEDNLPEEVFLKDENPVKKVWRKILNKDRPARHFNTSGKAYKAAIRKFWSEICQTYASDGARQGCRAIDDESPRPTSATVPGLCPSGTSNDNVHIDFSQ